MKQGCWLGAFVSTLSCRMIEQFAHHWQITEDECQISHLSVRCFLRCYQEHQSFGNAPLPGQPAEQVSDNVLNFTDHEMEENDELTAATSARQSSRSSVKTSSKAR